MRRNRQRGSWCHEHWILGAVNICWQQVNINLQMLPHQCCHLPFFRELCSMFDRSHAGIWYILQESKLFYLLPLYLHVGKFLSPRDFFCWPNALWHLFCNKKVSFILNGITCSYLACCLASQFNCLTIKLQPKKLIQRFLIPGWSARAVRDVNRDEGPILGSQLCHNQGHN